MVQYNTSNLARLKKLKCVCCSKKLPNWDNEVYQCWLRYINGADREKLIENTRFSSYISVRFYFRKHPCYKKIASFRKQSIRPVKTFVKIPLVRYPWLIGLYYADGSLRTKRTQLSFMLGTHEELIARRVDNELREMLSGNIHIARDLIGNMIQVRIHSVELCKLFPDKNDEVSFKNLWKSFNKKQKLNFIAGFTDGDGMCQYTIGINSVNIYSKDIQFILEPFQTFLSQFGYVSRQLNKIYLSPKVGKILKPYTVKKDIRGPYAGSIDVKLALKLLNKGLPVREIARQFNKDRKTITLALKKTYGIEEIQKYLDSHNTKLYANRA